MKVQRRLKLLTHLNLDAPGKKSGKKRNADGKNMEENRKDPGKVPALFWKDFGNYSEKASAKQGTNPDISRNFFGRKTGKNRKDFFQIHVSEFFPNIFRVFSENFPTLIHICSVNSPSTAKVRHDSS